MIILLLIKLLSSKVRLGIVNCFDRVSMAITHIIISLEFSVFFYRFYREYQRTEWNPRHNSG